MSSADVLETGGARFACWVPRDGRISGDDWTTTADTVVAGRLWRVAGALDRAIAY